MREEEHATGMQQTDYSLTISAMVWQQCTVASPIALAAPWSTQHMGINDWRPLWYHCDRCEEQTEVDRLLESEGEGTQAICGGTVLATEAHLM